MIDRTGAAMYLSEKTMNSLVVQLYLMGDPKNEYPELTLAHEQSGYPFVFNYNGNFYGPIKIWYVNKSKMTNIISRPEFTYPKGTYGGLDNLQFTTNSSN
jgi:hypothetical protein